MATTNPPGRRGLVFNFLLLANVLQYLEAGAVPALLLVISESFGMNSGQQGLLGGVVYLSLGIGGPFAGYLLRKFEHKTVLAWAVLANMIFTFLWAMTPVGRPYSTLAFISMRFMMGLSQCIVCVFLPLWTNENAPRKKRTTWMSYLQASVPFGVMMGYVIASGCVYFSAHSDSCLGLLCWRWPFLIEIGLLTPLYLGLYFIPAQDISVRISHVAASSDEGVSAVTGPVTSADDGDRPGQADEGSMECWMKLQTAEAVEERRLRQSWRRSSLSASLYDPFSTRDMIKRSYDDIALLADGSGDMFSSLAGFRWAGASQIPSPTDMERSGRSSAEDETCTSANTNTMVPPCKESEDHPKDRTGRPSLPPQAPAAASTTGGYGSMGLLEPVETLRYESLREVRRKSMSMSEETCLLGGLTPVLGRRRTASGGSPEPGSPGKQTRNRQASKATRESTGRPMGIAVPSSAGNSPLENLQSSTSPVTEEERSRLLTAKRSAPGVGQSNPLLSQGLDTRAEGDGRDAGNVYDMLARSLLRRSWWRSNDRKEGGQGGPSDMDTSELNDTDSQSGSESEEEWPEFNSLAAHPESPDVPQSPTDAWEVENATADESMPALRLTDRPSTPGPRLWAKCWRYVTCCTLPAWVARWLCSGMDDCGLKGRRTTSPSRHGGHHRRHWMRSIRVLLGMPVYRNLLGAMSALYFTVTGVQFWGTKYLLISLHAPLLLVNALFVVTAATAPVMGVIFGGYIIDVFGGYKGAKRRVLALEIVFALGCIGLACAIPITFCTSVLSAIVFLWLVLFFGGSILPACAGILVSVVPRYHRPTSASLSIAVFNMFGYCLSLVLSGYLMQVLQSYGDRCDEVCAMTWGFRLVLFWSGFSALFLVNALRAAHHQLREREDRQRSLYRQLDETL